MTLSLRTIVFIILISDAVIKNVIAFLTNATDKENNTKEYDTNPNTTHINYTALNILQWPQYFWFIIGFGTGVLIMLIINAKLYCQVWCPNNRIFEILQRRFVIWYNRCLSIEIYSVSTQTVTSECMSSAVQLEQRTSSAANMSQSTSFVPQLRQSTSTSQLPQSTSSASKLPQYTSLDSQLFQTTSSASELPQSQSLDSKLPASTSTVRQLPGPTPLSKSPQLSSSVSQSESQYKSQWLERYMKRRSLQSLPALTVPDSQLLGLKSPSPTFSSVPLVTKLLQSQSPNTQLRFIQCASKSQSQSLDSQLPGSTSLVLQLPQLIRNQSQSSQQSQPLKASQQSHMPQQQAPSIPVSNQLQVMAQPTTNTVTARITTIPAIMIAKSTAITTASTTSDINPEDYINPLFKY